MSPASDPDGNEADAVAQAAEVIAGAFSRPEDRAEAIRIVRRLMGWSGPLPPPDELVEYDRAHEGTATVIVEDFRRRSELDAAAVRHEVEAQSRELALQEREQQLRERESAADVRARWFVLRFGGFFLTLLAILAFAVLMWSPIDDATPRVVGAGVFITPIVVVGVILFLRGRMTEYERDVYRDTLPKLVESLASARTPSQPPPKEALPPTTPSSA